MERLTLKFVVSWLGLWASTAVSAPAGYYLGWAEVAPIERGIEVSFNPIDCNVCSFAVILRQSNGVLVAHFDVPLIASSDESAEAQEEKVVARDVHLIIDGSGRGSVTPPTLVLGKPGARIDVSFAQFTLQIIFLDS